jgi:hypothetical protein
LEAQSSTVKLFTASETAVRLSKAGQNMPAKVRENCSKPQIYDVSVIQHVQPGI